MTDDSTEYLYVFTLNATPHPAVMIDDPRTAVMILAPIVLAFDYAPTRDDLIRGYLDLNGFNNDASREVITGCLKGYDRDRFAADAIAHQKSGQPGFLSSGSVWGTWLLRCARVPVRKQVSLEGIRL